MNGYFKPLRRKIGVVTLLLACVCMVGWVRSRSNDECVEIRVSQHSRTVIGSTNSAVGLSLLTYGDPSEENSTFFDCWSWPEIGSIEQTVSIDGLILQATAESEMIGAADSDMKWYFRFMGLQVGQSRYQPYFNNQVAFAIIPYLFIAIPLALLSAWLLLSRPRAGRRVAF